MVGYLRLILAALVVYSHLNFAPWLLIGVHINQGVFAVFSFYLISGFSPQPFSIDTSASTNCATTTSTGRFAFIQCSLRSLF
jgi:hypothetical protein